MQDKTNLIKKKIVRKIKLNPIVRLLVKPFFDIHKRLVHERYIRTVEPQRLKALRNKFEGESIFLIGNGPSLRIDDLNKLKDKHTFGMNEIYALFDRTDWRPEFYMCIDKEDIDNLMANMKPSDAKYLFYRIESKKRNKVYKKNVYWIYSYIPFNVSKYKSVNPFISEDVTKEVREGFTVMFSAIQLAIYFGFKKIYLLGVDNKYSREIRRDGKEVEHKNRSDYASGIRCNFAVGFPDQTNEAYNAARKYCDSHNIEIYNVTRGGALEVFERRSFDELINAKLDE